ncbi:MAG: hypothetical protein HPY69_00825 [Armatimonadetes bacterium]|nr:hypothetical protein [Armatimonadota bacterium]
MAEAEASIDTTHEQVVLGGGERLSAATVIVAVGFLGLSLFWMLQAGIISHGVQLGESVPVVPAVGALLVLTVLGLTLRRLGWRWRVPPGQVLYIYCFLCVAVTMNSVGVARMLFPEATAVYYFATPENDFETLQKYMPTWLAPQDPKVIQEMYEGAADEKVPWKPWLRPLFFWTLFLGGLFVSMQGMTALFRRQWADKERLTFPIVQLVLDIADQEGRRVVGGFFGNPLMWVGFGIAALYNVGNILNAWNPAVPAMGREYAIGRFFTERPLSAINPLSIAWRPENIGLGYLVPTEITLSVWVFYLALRISNVIATAGGYEIAGFPFDREQSAGSYLVLALFLIWVARDHLKAAFATAFTAHRPLDDRGEPMSYRMAFLATFGGLALMLAIALKAGMWLGTALIYFGLVLLFALVYARARAEAGAAMVWLFPFYLHKQMMIHVAGSEPFSRGGNWSNLTMLSTFMFISRGFFQSLMAYQMESTKIAQEARLRQRTMVVWLLSALVLGLLGAYVTHLHAYYTHGANILEGGSTEGGYRVMLARQEFEELSSFLKAQRPPDLARTWAGLFGAVFTLGLILVRTYSLRFPLHPLGFAMVTSYGGPLWGPFLLVWIVKTVVLRIGGMRAYRRGIPFFLGIVMGHFFVAGLIWGWLSIINEMYRRYVVHFG